MSIFDVFEQLNKNKVPKPTGPVEYIIVGLGNPGSKYERTRHNAGFMVIDELSKAWNIHLSEEKKFKGEIGRGVVKGEKVILLKPTTFMNLSGESVRAVMDFYDVDIREIIDGERKSENMNEEVKETVLKLSDYTETINQKIKGRLFVLTVIAIIGMIAFVIIEVKGLDTPGSIYERVASAGLGLDFGVLIVLAMYLSGFLGKIKARREMKR